MASTSDIELLTSVQIPTDNDDLNRALTDLDVKLLAWSNAIDHAQSVFRQFAETTAQEEPSPKPTPTAKSPKPPSPPSMPSLHVVAESPFRPTEPPANDAAASATPIPAGLSAEDDALLDSLDAETRNRILVLRRLSGNSKSIRELIDKHRTATPKSESPQAPKKSFWRR